MARGVTWQRGLYLQLGASACELYNNVTARVQWGRLDIYWSVQVPVAVLLEATRRKRCYEIA